MCGESPAEREMRVRESRVECQRSPVTGDGFGGVPLERAQVAELLVRLGEVRCERQDRLELRDGLIGSAELLQQDR